MSYFGNYYLTGPDAQAAADWIFTNNMRKPTGETSYTCMLNAQAGVESDLTVSFIEGSATAPWEPSFEVLFRHCTIGSKILFSIKKYFHFFDRVKGFTSQPVADRHISPLRTFDKPSKTGNLMQNSSIFQIAFAYFPFKVRKGKTIMYLSHLAYN